jgi:hypothetical protein
MRKGGLIMGCVLLAGVAGGVAHYAATVAPATNVSPRELHTFMHIGCKHHNHGRKWHQDHGRIFRGDGRNVSNDD